ncbi:MAG: class A beta-lactamase-related serine hydrolase [Candidatus Saccharicenans sp.]|nr:class A beta-lactamase-related serine hydrolase [Candidatus Saccharicenans sp.]
MPGRKKRLTNSLFASSIILALLVIIPLKARTAVATATARSLTPEEKLWLYNLRQERWEANSRQILQRISSFRGETGLMVKDLQTGWTFLHNEEARFPAASLIKIPIMVACFKAVEDGRLDLREKYVLRRQDRVGGSGLLRRMRNGRTFTYEELIDYMVTHSDNIATNVIIKRLGFDYIKEVFDSLGLKDTVLNRLMMDFRAREEGLENYTSAREMTGLLEMIYYGRCLSAGISEKCLDVLKRQRINDRLPRFLPREATVAHKTGQEREVCHDAGIVFSPHGDYIITVLVRTWSGPLTTKTFIARLSSYFYQIFKT